MRNRLWAGLCGLTMLAVLGSGVAGCTPERGSPAVIEVDAPVAQVDQAVHIRIGGLTPGEQVTVGARVVDALGRQWRARATFLADPQGVVDLDTANPKPGGTYRNPDGMGLFRSMNPLGGAAEASFVPAGTSARGYVVTLTAVASGRALVSRTPNRVWCGTGVTSAEITLATDRISGQDGTELELGGTRAADAAAWAEGRPKVLALLASLTR
ncbi:acyl-CoA thioesterase/BAAT N-terminal domain-containing protein [Embleya sp. NPDC050154]|uniref:acyl-CoA thioesterase/BAAT N-terminal domain-containing protein n=1 Tax=Embleya sp. NPDC050154 TaxID=3363988 RepID=UPI0037ACCB06